MVAKPAGGAAAVTAQDKTSKRPAPLTSQRVSVEAELRQVESIRVTQQLQRILMDLNANFLPRIKVINPGLENLLNRLSDLLVLIGEAILENK